MDIDKKRKRTDRKENRYRQEGRYEVKVGYKNSCSSYETRIAKC